MKISIRYRAVFGLAVFFSTLVGLASVAEAGFYDNGFVNPKVRSDYNDPLAGTVGHELSIGPCLFPGVTTDAGGIVIIPGCIDTSTNPPSIPGASATLPTDWSLSNFFSQNNPGSRFWVISANNEPYFNTGNSGPPNQSHAIVIPGEPATLMEFTLLTNSLPGESFWRAHMIVDNSGGNPVAGGIPFLGLGADVRRGNGELAGTLGGDLALTSFTARLWDTAYTPGPNAAAFLYVFAFAQWGGIPHGVFIQLYHEGYDASDPSTGIKGMHFHWDWQFTQSFYSPGADLAYVDAEDVLWACGNTSVAAVQPQVDTAVIVDWNRVFRCMSNAGLFDTPMPSGLVGLLGVHWAVEVAGPADKIWASVHGMTMIDHVGGPLGPQQSAVIPPGWTDPTTVKQMKADFWEGCLANSECVKHNWRRMQGQPWIMDYAKLKQPLGIPRAFVRQP